MEDGFKAKIIDHTGKEYKFSELPKIKILYFSAHWCPPCKKFTPALVELYKAINAKEKKVEVIYVSCDSDKKQFEEYYGSMPWLAVDYDEPSRKQIGNSYGVSGIPHPILVDDNGKQVGGSIRGDVPSGAEACLTKWTGLYNQND